MRGSFAPFVWHNKGPFSPIGMPFEQSKLFTSVEFAGRYATYEGADTWYPSWAADGNMYSPWTDGLVNKLRSHSACAGEPCMSTTGFATVVGNDPLDLRIEGAGTFESSPSPYHGRYPCGSLVYNGTWLYGTYALDNENHQPGASPLDAPAAGKAGYCENWCISGPFVGFRWSDDHGHTWHEPRVSMSSWDDNIFGEAAPDNHTQKVKFGAPHVVDLGQELEHRPAGDDAPLMYVVGHGASQSFSPTSWMQGSEIYMARVPPTPAATADRSAWEFYAGNGAWRTGVVTMTYLAPVRRYLMCVSTPTFSPFTEKQFDTYLLEASDITGPFRLISYLREFGPQAYFVNVPSKFVSPKLEADGSLRVYLSYSANFAFGGHSKPPGSGYHWTLTEILLKP